MRVGMGDLTNMFAAYGATIGRGIGDYGDYIADPTAIFGMSACPTGYQSDGRAGCVSNASTIGPTPPPGYVDPNILLGCGAGTYAVNGQCVAVPSTTPASQVPTPNPSSKFSLSTTQMLLIGAAVVGLVFVMGGRR